MGTWHDLPPEIHDHILQLFCLDVISTYADNRDRFDEVLDNCHRLQSNWARPPQVLKHFASAIRTCRSFYNSIVHIIKIDGESPVDELQERQRYRVEIIMECSRGHQWPIELYTVMAGLFWRNPCIYDDAEFMVQIMSSLAYESLALLLPHLGEWVVEYASRVSEEDWDITGCELYHAGDGGDQHDYAMVIHPGSYEVRFQTDSPTSQAIRSINGLYQGSRYMRQLEAGLTHRLHTIQKHYTSTERGYTMLQTKMNNNTLRDVPFFREVHNSEPDTWWLFELESDMWYVINYAGKRIWGSQCLHEMCYWEDVWDPTTWKLGSKGRKLGREWFQFFDVLDPSNEALSTGNERRSGGQMVLRQR